MGTLGDTGRIASFNNDVFPVGVDLDRSKWHQDLGTYKINPGSIIRPGMIVTREGAAGDIFPVDSAPRAENRFGVAKWGNEPLGISTVMDLPITVTAGGTSNTKPNITGAGPAGSLQIRTAEVFGGVALVEGAGNDYTVDLATGVVTWLGTVSVPDGTVVYATFAKSLTTADLRFQGVKFHSNTSDDVTNSSEGRLTVFTDWAILFTVEWDTTRVYTTTGPGSNLYCNDEGKFSNDPGLSNLASRFVGRVAQLPIAGDPFLGVEITGGPTIAP
jgi:hypothetical protein